MSAETPVFTGAGPAFTYAAATGAWTPLDEGLSGAYIYFNQSLKIYRVIAIAQSNQKFVINSTLQVGTAFQRNNDQFISWVDPFGVFGINFSTKEQADEFVGWLERIVTPPATPQAAEPAQAAAANASTSTSTGAVAPSVSEPARTAEPLAPTKPAEPASAGTAKPAEPTETAKPAEPVKSDTVQPAETPKPAEPATSSQSTASVQSPEPAGVEQKAPTEQPAKLAEVSEAVKAASSEPAKVVEPAAAPVALKPFEAQAPITEPATPAALLSPRTIAAQTSASSPAVPTPRSAIPAVAPIAPISLANQTPRSGPSATPRGRSGTNPAPLETTPKVVAAITPRRPTISSYGGLPPPTDLPPPPDMPLPDVPPPAPPVDPPTPRGSDHHKSKKDKDEKKDKDKKEKKGKDKKEKDKKADRHKTAPPGSLAAQAEDHQKKEKKRGSERRPAPVGGSAVVGRVTDSPPAGSPSGSAVVGRPSRNDDDSSASSSYIRSGPDDVHPKLPDMPPPSPASGSVIGSAVQGREAPLTPTGGGRERPASVRASVLMTPRSTPPVAAAPTPGLPPLPQSAASMPDVFSDMSAPKYPMNRIQSMYFNPPTSLGGSAAPASPARLIDQQPGYKPLAPENLVPRDLTSDASTAVNERDMAVKELYLSEVSYLGNIERIGAVFDKITQDQKEKGDQAPMNRDVLQAVFLNIKNIRFLNNKLAANLKTRLQQWTDRVTISDVFLELLPYFKEYRTFCSGYESAVTALDAALKKKDLSAYIKGLESTLLEKGKTLQYLLVLPTQRLPRYVQSLEGILKWTPPEHPDQLPARQLIERLHEFYVDLNEHIRRTENLKKTKLQAANKNFSPSLQALFVEGRVLVHEDPNLLVKFATANARNNPPAVHAFVFSDLLVFAQKVSDKKHKLEPHSSMPLEYAWLDLARVTEREITLLTIVDGLITIEFTQVPEKNLFIRMFNDALLRHLRAKNVRSSKDDVMLQRHLSVRPEEGVEIEGFFEYAKLHGEASMRWKSGASYSGGWEEGKMQGKGRFIYKTGETLEGQWRENAPHGRAKLTTPDGSYDGDWDTGIRSGQGELRWKNGDVYVGQFHADLIDGKGKYTAANGQSGYDGQWKAMLRHGTGTLKCARFSYSGEWVEDRREGQGTLRLANGDDYTGQFKDDQRAGSGVFVSGDGRVRYEGEWARDKRNGRGTLSVAGEFKYEGEFRDDQRHGQGVLRFEDGSVYEGNFKEDVFELQGKLTRPSGEVYDGQWHNGQRQGKGVMVGVTGGKYTGDWYKDDRHGKGVMVDQNCCTYDGDWQYNFRHGLGTFSNADGSIRYVGTWERDRRHGKGTQTDKLGRYEGLWKEDCWHGHGRYQYHSGVVLEGVWQNGVRHGESHIFLPGQLSEPAYVITYKQGAPLSAPSSEAVLESLFLTPPPPKTYFRM